MRNALFSSLPLASLLPLLALACGDPTIPIDEDAVNVSIVDNGYISNHILVFPDQQVVWTWNGSNSHSVTFLEAVDGSPVQSEGQFQTRFAGPSGTTYNYFCSVHGAEVMAGIVMVR